jgi:hypothetical protein
MCWVERLPDTPLFLQVQTQFFHDLSHTETIGVLKQKRCKNYLDLKRETPESRFLIICF